MKPLGAAIIALTVALGGAATAQVQDTLPATPPLDMQAIATATQTPGEIFGPLTAPNPTGAGLHLFLELARSTCLIAEAGATLDQLAHDGYSVTDKELHQLGWLMGEETDSALSVTGDEILDTDGGHPYFYLFDDDGVLTCRAHWNTSDPVSETDARYMAQMLQVELPARFQMIPTTQGATSNLAMRIGVLNYQRPCGGQWCTASTLFSFNTETGIELSLTFTLNP